LVTSASLSHLLLPFGATDASSIVLTLKPPKKAPQKPPKYGVALVTFEQISQAFDAVNASGRADHGLDGIEVGWVEGKEPQILGWLKRIGKLASPESTQSLSNIRNEGSSAPLSSSQTRLNASVFSSFPTSFVSPNRSRTGANDNLCAFHSRISVGQRRALQPLAVWITSR
jgi:DnaJ family protein C protein 17